VKVITKTASKNPWYFLHKHLLIRILLMINDLPVGLSFDASK
jgi:hypothetical protein